MNILYKRLLKLMMIVVSIALFSTTMLLAVNVEKRNGTTIANFLEVGVGSDGIAMGGAMASIGGSFSSVYWNPAGLAYSNRSGLIIMNQPWFADINTNYFAGVMNIPSVGKISLSYYQFDYGEMEVTSMRYQEGTGEMFSASDYSLALGYSRKLAQWFAFGIKLKYINSSIKHCNASATALDLGVIVNTGLFSFTGKEKDGLNIGMSIANYGNRMKYDGQDLLFPIDIEPEESGNFPNTTGKFETQEWELPLICRIGFSHRPIAFGPHKLMVSTDFVIPNNNQKYMNLGTEYKLNISTSGSIALRAGYHGLFLPESIYGLTFGGGFKLNLMGNAQIGFDYAFRDISYLGEIHSYTLSLIF